MSGRSNIFRIDGCATKRKIVDKGFPDLDKFIDNPCEVLGGVYHVGRRAVSDGLGVIGSALSDAGSAVDVLAIKTAPKEVASSAELAKDLPSMFGPRPFMGESSL